MSETAPSPRGPRWLLCLLLLAALALRAADFPGRYVYRDGDERPYTQSGLALWEGMTPTNKYCPAGPQIWISWLYAGFYSTRDFLLPSREDAAVPFVLRPFVAVNHALFDIYHDWSRLRQIQSAVNFAATLAAVAAGFELGRKRGGLPAALIVAGMAAAMPIWVELSVEARPYTLAWDCGLIAFYFSAKGSDGTSAIFMGLAVASRIDMLVLVPLAWTDLWPSDRFMRRAARYTALAALTTLLVAPWLLTNLIGNVREIATIRVAIPDAKSDSTTSALNEIFIQQGLGVVIILAMTSLFLAPPGRTKPRWMAAIYVLLLTLSMLKATNFGIRHQGGPFVALIAFSAVGASALWKRWPALAWVAAAAAIAPTFVVAALDVAATRQAYVAPHPTEWLERHIMPGTRVYLSPRIHDPLPTQAASDALWAEVADGDAWKAKIETAMKRYHISADELPRALSEENMIQERGNRREWFILGGLPKLQEPRFDIRVIMSSPVFGVQDASAEFRRTGGVLIWDDFDGRSPDGLGQPVVQWVNGDGKGVRVYCSSEVAARFLDAGDLGAW